MPPKTSSATTTNLPPQVNTPPDAPPPKAPPATESGAATPPKGGDHLAKPTDAGVLAFQSALSGHGHAHHHAHKPKGDSAKPKGDAAKTSSAATKPTAAELASFDAKIKQIRQHSAYKALSADGKKTTEEIIKTARTKPNATYYADKLKLLFDTPDAPPTKVATSNQQQVQDSLKASKARLSTPAAKANVGKEEAITADKSRTWTKLQGDGAKYYVDRSDKKNIVVKMKVQVTGDAKSVAATKALEDDIEKEAAALGYTLDIEFVNHGGDDVFTVGADAKKWTTATNWVGSTFDIAHEAHHLLGLDDRYDYIESHADNAEMKMETRLHWFNVQVKKPFDANGKYSMMGDGAKPLHDDVCKVAQVADEKACIDTRKKAHGGR